MKNGFYTRTLIVIVNGFLQNRFQFQLQDDQYMVRSACCVYGGTGRELYIGSCLIMDKLLIQIATVNN